MTKLIKLLLKLSKLFSKKKSHIELLDVDPKVREKLKEKFGVPKNHQFGSVMPPVDSSNRKAIIKKILDNKKKHDEQI